MPFCGTVIGGRLWPGLFSVGNWKMLMPVPWKDDDAVVELGLWSRLSRAPTQNSPFLRHAGATQPSFSKRSETAVASHS